jgi:hypothetical protein
MALTLKQILASVPRDRLLLSREVVINKFKRGFIKASGQPMVACSSHSPHHPKTGERVSNPPKYVTVITGLEGAGKAVSRQYVEVSCSCEDFCFVWEYALNRKGAAQIKFCNGEPPGAKNPRNIAGACKHVAALASHVNRMGW